MGTPDGGMFRTRALNVVHSWAMFSLVTRHVVPPLGEEFERTYVSTPGAVAIVAVTVTEVMEVPAAL